MRSLLALLALPLAAHATPVAVDFYGTALRADLDLPYVADASGTRDVLAADERALAPLADWVDDTVRDLDLDDYGRFRLTVAAVDGLGLRTTRRSRDLLSVSEALDDGVWTRRDRALAIAATLRGQDIGVDVMVFDDDVALLVAADGDAGGLSITRRVGRGRHALQARFLPWHDDGRLGEIELSGHYTAPCGDHQPYTGRALHLDRPELPSVVLDERVPRTLEVHGSDAVLPYDHLPEVLAYLSMLPELDAAGHLWLARTELEAAGFEAPLRRLARRSRDREELVNTLLRTIQSETRYVVGPLRPATEILADREGDCDQLSTVLGGMLLLAGVDADDILVVDWPGHVALAVAPADADPRGASLRHQRRRYYILDATMYVRGRGGLASAWGDLGQGGRGRASVHEIG